ncbi:protoporphyrinogen oxidase, partial [Arthrobacter sp. H14]|uniref:protoporphyrinogen oxidase n=1 Tax=Arthrobacter sp. H14 TaxID=1312959 RepID=UPI002FDD514F
MPHTKPHTKLGAKPHGKKPARPTAVVIGGGMAGLLAARELVTAGIEVTLVEASDRFGGCVGVHEVASLKLDSGAESFATRSTAVSDLVRELGLGDRLVEPNPAGAWVQLPEGASPLPKTGVLGIPAEPWDPEVRLTLGFRGALRASLDRWLPASTGTKSELSSVSDLVRARMGQTVLERLVTPVVSGVHSADPALLDVDMVAPRLRRLVVEKGSLSAAVAELRAGAKAGSAVGSLAGGMYTLVTALVEELKQTGVKLVTGTPVTELKRNDAAAGEAPAAAAAAGETEDAGEHAGSASGKSKAVQRTKTWTVTANGKTWTADAVVVATEGPGAVGLVSDVLPEMANYAPWPAHQIKIVTLVLDMPELDAPTRGTGILVAPQTPGIQAKALTHATSKWAWLADEAGPGTHVLRLSYGRMSQAAQDSPEAPRIAAELHDAGEDVKPEPETDAELLEAAVSDAAALLGIHITEADLLGSGIVRWQGALPFAAVGHKKRVDEARKLAGQLPGFAMVGSWLAGTGLTAVTADARKTAGVLAERLVEEP